MASATMNFSSSSLSSKFPYHPHLLHKPCSISKPNLQFLSLSLSLEKLSLVSQSISPIKATTNEATTISLSTPVIETKPLPPKPQEIFAVVMVGSRQYIVIPGRWIYCQRLKGASVNDKIVLSKVLLVGTRNSTYVGKPIVTNAVVHAVVEEQLLDKKVIVFKYKKKKNYRRNIGHRQPITRIKITGITGFEDFPASTLES